MPRPVTLRRSAALLAVALIAGLSAAPAQAAPRMADVRAAAVAPGEATVRGVLTPAARATAFHVSFARRGSRAWRRTPARRAAGGGRPRRVTIRLRGLRPGAGYRVRLVATTCRGCRRGTTRSAVRAVRTAPAPTPAVTSPPVGASSPVTPPASPPPPEPSRTPVPTPTPAEHVPEPAPPPSPPGYTNPVLASAFPDPMVLREGDWFYAYGTGDRLPVMRSRDLVSWERVGTALAQRPTWAAPVEDWHAWAPSVLRIDGPCPDAAAGPCFLLFHVGLRHEPAAASGDAAWMHCIGVASAASPSGPFEEIGRLERADRVRERDLPIGCGDAGGHGNIDPAPFVAADGSIHLYLSTDWRCDEAGSCQTLAPEISVIPLDPDAPWQAAGPRTPLLAGAAGTWEEAPWAPVAENPWVVERDGVFHLLYSAGAWNGAYGMGHATAPSPTGPFTRSAPTSWVTGTASVGGPGGGMVVEDGAGAEWLAYHGRSGDVTSPRELRIDRLRWTADDRPQLDGPTSEPQADRPTGPA